MKLILNRIIFFLTFFCFTTIHAKDFQTSYNVSTSGVKIGTFDWSLKVEDNKYITEIHLKNSGIFSPLYRFEGEYFSNGLLIDNQFIAKQYKQSWITKKQSKVVEISFDNGVTNLFQSPEEDEVARINVESLFQYYDPITSFINILSGSDEAKTIDGRRVYVMKKEPSNNLGKIKLKIKNYINIWADHKRNDLEKIEFYLNDNGFLPEKIKIFFKKRVFNLKMN